MLLEILSGPVAKALAVNATGAAFPVRVPTKTLPPDVIPFADPGGNGIAQTGLFLIPYAVAAAGDTFSIRFVGWRRVGDGETKLLVPFTLGEVACTVSTPTGIDGTPVVSTELFCTTITLTVGSDVAVDIVSPGDTTIASLIVATKGCQNMSVDFRMDLGATSANALIGKL